MTAREQHGDAIDQRLRSAGAHRRRPHLDVDSNLDVGVAAAREAVRRRAATDEPTPHPADPVESGVGAGPWGLRLARVALVLVAVPTLVWLLRPTAGPDSSTTADAPPTTAPSPTSSSTPTGEAAARALVVEPGPYPYPTDLAAGSGCTPGPGPLPDGTWFVSVLQAPPEAATSVEVDLVCAFGEATVREAGFEPSFERWLFVDEVPLTRVLPGDGVAISELATLVESDAPIVVTVRDGALAAAVAVDDWLPTAGAAEGGS